MSELFSERHGLGDVHKGEITVRYDAPDALRNTVVDIAYESNLSPSDCRTITCRLLGVAPDRNNWSEFPNIDREVRDSLLDCEWYFVYDFIEILTVIVY